MGNEQLTIAVDFDGVIADHDGWKGETHIGSPRRDVIDVLRVLRTEGWRIIVHSCRSAEEIHPYLVENDVPFDEINKNSARETRGVKPAATVYWDDRAHCYSGDAHKDLAVIRNFHTWNGRR